MTDESGSDAIEILVDGFFDNPVLAWIFRDESTRAEAIDTWLWRSWAVRYSSDSASLHTSSVGSAAFSSWE